MQPACDRVLHLVGVCVRKAVGIAFEAWPQVISLGNDVPVPAGSAAVYAAQVRRVGRSDGGVGCYSA